MNHKLVTDDDRLSYTIVPKPDDSEFEPIDGVKLCSNEHTVGYDKYDMYVPLTENDKAKHEHPLPLSFMQIKEGDVEAGAQWYRDHYPKIPDELIDIMARYNFGDLKYATRKSIRNDRSELASNHGVTSSRMESIPHRRHFPFA